MIRLGAFEAEPPKPLHMKKWASNWGSPDPQQEQGHSFPPSEGSHGAVMEEGKGYLLLSAYLRPGIL